MPELKDSLSIEGVLKYIVACFGKEIYQDKQRLSNLIADLYTGEERWKRLYMRMIKDDSITMHLYDISLRPIRERQSLYEKVLNIIGDINFYYNKTFIEQILEVFVIALDLQLDYGEWFDSSGVKYSANKELLISAPNTLHGIYQVKVETKIICKKAFKSCKNTLSLYIPDSVMSIEEDVFPTLNTSLTIVISKSLWYRFKSIWKQYDCNFQINGNKYVTKNNILTLCSIDRSGKDYTILEDTKVLAPKAFAGCVFSGKIVIPFGVEIIDMDAFCDCFFRSIELPSSMKEIREGNGDYSGFKYSTIIIKDTYIWYKFKSILERFFCYMQVEGNKYELRDNSLILLEVDRKRRNYILLEETKIIGFRAFAECKDLTEFIVPQGVEVIYEKAFYGCSRLKKVELPISIKVIQKEAFACCEDLTEIEIPSGVEVICEKAFSGCSNLRKVELPISIKEIQEKAFDESVHFIIPKNKYGIPYLKVWLIVHFGLKNFFSDLINVITVLAILLGPMLLYSLVIYVIVELLLFIF